ncbi:SAF domain-containing protein [Actinomadura sp. SCN-SB]|uniref:SAF domain-containing protein n=1 Tax=Actinomadura sp. SCN-SB TaxID=3373092 RepID=UPI00375064F3
MAPLSKTPPKTAHDPHPGAGDGQARRPAPRLARQRRPGWIAAGVMLMAVAVLANVYLFRTSSERVSVVRMARDVPVGQQITRADLNTALAALDSQTSTIPGRQLPEVVGQRAAVDLRQGTLLAASQVTTQLTPQRGHALVTAALKPSQLPRGLAPGWQVRIVATTGATTGTQGQPPAEQNTAGGPGQSTPARDVLASVDQVGGPDADGVMTVSLLVADADSSAVARQAATGQIALVVTARGG